MISEESQEFIQNFRQISYCFEVHDVLVIRYQDFFLIFLDLPVYRHEDTSLSRFWH